MNTYGCALRVLTGDVCISMGVRWGVEGDMCIAMCVRWEC